MHLWFEVGIRLRAGFFLQYTSATDEFLCTDGTYYTAMMLANEDGTEEDVAICLQALSEMRWGFAKTAERSAK